MWLICAVRSLRAVASIKRLLCVRSSNENKVPFLRFSLPYAGPILRVSPFMRVEQSADGRRGKGQFHFVCGLCARPRVICCG